MNTACHPHFRRIVLAQLQRVRWQLAAGLLCIVGSTLAALAAPWPIKLVFDQVLLVSPGSAPAHDHPTFNWLVPHSLGALALLCVALLLIAVFAGLCGYLQQVMTTRIGYTIVATLRSALFDHVQRLSLAFHNRARSGELMSKITADTNTLRDVYSQYVLVFLTHSLTVVGMLAVLLVLDWRLGLITTLSFPVLFALLVARMRRVKASSRRQRSNEGQLANRVGEMLGTISLVQAFGREHTERERFDAESQQSIEENIRAARAEAGATRLVEITTAAGTAVVLMAGGAIALQGALSPGDLLVFVSYVTAMYKPVKNLARLSARMSRAQASVERIDEILSIEPEVQDSADAVDAPVLRGEIVFEHVHAQHEGRAVLHDINLRIPAGQRLAIVGPSGAGKSTLARLLIRLIEPSQGTVRIDDTDIRRWKRASLRAQIGVVLQDNLLLGASVRDNIAYGKADASDAEVEAAARLAQAHEFIAALPGGYAHELGPGGATLSGGQRQRLCLARALIKAPPILLMDEPTSAVDAQSERQIRAAVQAAQQGRTSILIAHQLQSVLDADWIVVLRDGRIVEQGTHAQLSAHRGVYAELFQPAGAAPAA